MPIQCKVLRIPRDPGPAPVCPAGAGYLAVLVRSVRLPVSVGSASAARSSEGTVADRVHRRARVHGAVSSQCPDITTPAGEPHHTSRTSRVANRPGGATDQ